MSAAAIPTVPCRRLVGPRARVTGLAVRLLLLPALLAAAAQASRAGEFSDEFDRQRFKDSLAQEIAFREAAIHIAWGAEPLCDDTTEIEPFVLWSTRTLRRGLSAHHQQLFKQATGMDEFWRVAWLDEATPDELKLGDRVTAINGKALPSPSSKVELTAVLRGGSVVSVDDQAFWEVMHQVRETAGANQTMVLTLDGGREVKVGTQTGCAGAVTASPFDDEPANFQRQEGRRSKIPGNALLEARGRDEYRWLAAFGTYFLASSGSVLRQRSADSMGQAFLIGKVLTVALPGAGTVLAAIEAQSQRTIQVDGLVGGADLFANEVVMAMGGDPSAGLKLSDRLKAKGIRADVVVLSDFRRSGVELHLRSLREIDAARRRADEAAERDAPAAATAAAPTPAAPPGGIVAPTPATTPAPAPAGPTAPAAPAESKSALR